MKVFGTKYSADSTDSPTDSYSVEYKDDAIVITLKSLNETITAPCIESTSETPITVKLNGSSAITAHKSTNADFTFIKSRGAVTITPENNNSELTIGPAVSGQQLAAAAVLQTTLWSTSSVLMMPVLTEISFELGADFTIAANSTITLDNNFTLVVDGTEFTAASAPSGTSSRIRCAGEGPCHGIIDIKGSAKAVFNGNIGDQNINGEYALKRYNPNPAQRGESLTSLWQIPITDTSIGNVGFSIQAGTMTLGSASGPTVNLAL